MITPVSATIINVPGDSTTIQAVQVPPRNDSNPIYNEFDRFLLNESLEHGNDLLQSTNPDSDPPIISEDENVSYLGSTIWAGVTDVEVRGSYAYCIARAGFEIYDITNSAYPINIGQLYYRWQPKEIDVVGNYAYTLSQDSGLYVINISDPFAPMQVGHYDTTKSFTDISVYGDYAFCTISSPTSLLILSVEDPAHPTLVGYYQGGGYSVFAVGNYVYLISGSYLQVLDVIDKSNPVLVGSYSNPYNIQDIYVYGEYAYLTDTYYDANYNIYGDLRVLVISTPDSIYQMGYCPMPAPAFFRKLVISGDYAFVVKYQYDYVGGMQIFNISNPSSPAPAGYYSWPYVPWGVSVSGNYAYLADNLSGLIVIDVTNPYSPTFSGRHYTGQVNSVVASGNYAFVAYNGGGIAVVDILDPTNPSLITFRGVNDFANDIALAGGYAYLAKKETGLGIFNISNPNNPIPLGSYNTSGYAISVNVSDQYAFIVGDNVGMQIIDVSNTSNPTLAGTFSFPAINDLAVSGDYAFLVGSPGGMMIVNINNPSSPSLVARFDSTRGLGYIAVSGPYAYITGSNPGLKVVDISDPVVPTEVGSYGTSCGKIVVNGFNAYVAGSGLEIINVFNPAFPFKVGSYFTNGSRKDFSISDSVVLVADYYALLALNYSGATQVGNVSGHVINSSGQIIKDAKVNLLHNGNTARTSLTDYNGYYSFDSVLVGYYDLEVSKTGYGTSYMDNIRINPDEQLVADFTLNSLPQLLWSIKLGFMSNGVNPDTGTTQTEFEFRIVYSDLDNDPPLPGYPKIKIDINGDGVIDSLSEGRYSMWPVDGDTSYIDGKEYFYQCYLPESPDIQYAFETYDANSLPAQGDIDVISWNSGPYVSDQINDLAIRAGDISFSDNHPDPSEEVTILASVTSNSPGPLNDVIAYLYIGNDLVDSSLAQIVNVGYSENIFRFTYVFPQDYFYSVRVEVDPFNLTNDYNMLNNAASRGILVGNYTIPGGIALNISSPSIVCIGDSRVPFGIEAHYFGLGYSDSIPVSGATVTYHLLGWPENTTFTNDFGLADGQFTIPPYLGDFTLEVSITDYTLSRTERVDIEVIDCDGGNGCDSNLVSIGQVNIDLCNAGLTFQPFRVLDNICPAADASNNTDHILEAVQYGVYLDGSLLDSLRTITNLLPNNSIGLNEIVLPTPLSVGRHNLTIKLDPLNALNDCIRSDNQTSDNFYVWPDSDLMAMSAWYTPNSPTVYDDIDFFLAVKNTGFFELGPVLASFINIDSGDTLGYDSTTVISERGGTHIFSLENLQFSEGCRNIKLVVDPFNSIPEYNETNNYQIVYICVDSLLPDFQVTSNGFGLTDPTMGLPGQNGIFAIVRNIGNDNADSVLIEFYEDDQQIGDDIYLDMPSGSRDSVAVPYSLDFQCHTLSVYIDPDNSFREKSEANNTATGRVPFEIVVEKLNPCPGLFVHDPMFSECDICLSGDQTRAVTVQTRLYNSGLLDAPPYTPVLIDDYYEPDSVYQLDQVTLTHRSGPITRDTVIAFDTSGIGSHLFTIVAEPNGWNQECDTLNNRYARTLNISGCIMRADLVPDIFAERSCNSIAETSYYSIRIHNNGNMSSIPTTAITYLDSQPFDTLDVDSIAAYSSSLIADKKPITFAEPGSKTLSVFVDPDNIVTEFSESNNVDQTTINILPDSLDFEVFGYQLSDYTPDSTQNVTVSATIRNNGGYDLTGDLEVAFEMVGYGITLYDTISTLNSCFDTDIASVNFVFYLLDENCVNVTVDPANEYAEMDELNNTLSFCFNVDSLKPDLAISSGDINYTESNPAQGSQVYIDIMVHNLGRVDVDSARVKIFMDSTRIGNDIIVFVPARDSSIARSTMPWVVDRFTPKTIYAFVDSANVIVESNETNNTAQICAIPEIALRQVNICPQWNSDEHIFSRCPAVINLPLGINSYFSNVGAMDIGTSTNVSFYDVFADDTTLIDTSTFSYLAGHGAKLKRSTVINFVESQIGNHNILLIVDESNVVPECDDNNLEEYGLNVVGEPPDPGDLYTRSMYIDISNVHPEVGELVSVSATIFNDGPFDVVDTFGVRFMLDENQLGDDVYIPGLSAESTFNYASVSATMPWEAINLPTPLHVLRVIADPNNTVLETDEDNNEATRAIVVGDVPDLSVSLAALDSCVDIEPIIPLSLEINNFGTVDVSAELLCRQVILGGDTIVVDSRPIFVESLSNQFEDYSLALNSDSLYFIFTFINIYPEDYILENNTLVLSWENCPGCDYVIGDVNGSGSYNGLDVTYGVAFLKGGNPPMCQPCPLCPDWHYCGDVNGSCNYNGLDITYGVAYLKGGSAPVPCGDCPPIGGISITTENRGSKNEIREFEGKRHYDMDFKIDTSKKQEKNVY
jgi:subtilase family serine protease